MKKLIALSLLVLFIAGCTPKCSICDDVQRIESINRLINDFERAKLGNPAKSEVYDDFIEQLKANRLTQVIRCLKEKGAKIADHIPTNQ